MSDFIEINAEVDGTEALSADVSTNEDIAILDDASVDEVVEGVLVWDRVRKRSVATYAANQQFWPCFQFFCR